MAKKSDRKAAVAVRELKHPWLVPLLACIYFIVTCMMFHGENKLITLLLILSSIVCVVVRNGVLSRRLTLPALLLGLYVLLDGISTLYAPSGKFALYEFLKVASAACMALLLTGCEPERDAPCAGRCAAVVLEVSGALASLFSIDMVSTRWLYNGLCGLIRALGVPFGNEALQGQRLRTIFENPNVFAGAAGIALLLSLGLAASAASKKERCLHLSCLLITCTAFILAVSRGAMGAVAAAFLAYLLLSRGPQRATAFILMAETLLLTLLASLFTFTTAFGEWTLRPWPLLVTLLCAAALCALDIYVGRPLADKLSQRMKTVNIILLAALAAVAALVVLAVSWTGPATLQPGETITRGAYLTEGDYTLSVTADGPVSVTVLTQTEEDAIMNTKQTAYTGPADGASFTAPAGNRSVTFVLTADSAVRVTAVSYGGAASGALKLNYKLLPEAIAERIQNLFSEGNVVQRLVYCADGLKLFQRSPIVGVGMGGFENGIYSVQTYHYETKYVHNHYIQSLVDTGVLGCVLWLGLLLSSAAAILRLWRKGRDGQPHPMTAALGAALLFVMIHAAVEVDFSSGYFLPFGIGAFAVISLTCGQLAPVPRLGDMPRRLLVWAAALCLAVFGVLLSMNMRAAVLAQQRDYDSIAQAADLDPYEWADYELSYVVAASAEENLPDDMRAVMERYLADLAALHSNSVPRYLARCYFNLNDVDNGFAMLEQYVDYTPSDPATWENSFRVAMEHDDGSDAFRQGVAALAQRLSHWNDANLGTITLPEDVQAYLNKQ